MDNTQLFKAYVKTVKHKKRSIQSSTNTSKSDSNKNENLNKKSNNFFKELLFQQRTKIIIYQITQLKNFLLENRAAYIKFGCHLKRFQQITDEERDVIDSESEKIITFCDERINELKKEITKEKKKLSNQLNEHVERVLDILTEYLKCINKLHSDQKQYRMQRDVENYKLLKLGSIKGNENIIKSNSFENLKITNGIKDNDNYLNDSIDSSGLRHRKQTHQRTNNKLSLDDEITNYQLTYNYEQDLTAEDIQMFESENVQLFNELKGLSEEVQQIEKNVVDIARLQDIFTEKVTLQKHDIDRIANTVIGSTENVRDANEQIKQAIQRNAGLRVYILFFLIVMSFSLLFLDWYND